MISLLSLIKGVGLKVWAYVGLVVAGLVFMYKIFEAGEKGAKVDSLELTLNSVRRSKEIEANVDGLSDDDVAARLKENGWFRE